MARKIRRKSKKTNVSGLILRYFLLIATAVPNFWIFSVIFTPLTIYPSYFIASLFFRVSLSGNTLMINGNFPIELTAACIATAAYYLLFIFNISVPNIKLKKRIAMIGSSFLALLLLNLMRIILLVSLYSSGAPYFELVHKIFWYALSTVFVIGIWFAEVRIFKIKDIPVYSDIKSLWANIRK